ncbi:MULTISPECIES: single-stranded-DNA-specific exonuclease RecJ [unclassified Lentimonas]|uniref:single-stranded-DNA-specific exonuclease RecJ n=1 Tax=unclassified Lentimonas TaxID=2630993 RepID=UPI00132B1D58|nr:MULTISPECIES: single-stranded-DNA-specific exonuclease RecJ [unclassified Lentimonas]CAA6694249.1 Single-stranded-DNA-specific exonuclease RecJ (EC [Lentimonas sp. CC19]CAA6694258.1 Single-stranded-DNA-specific exonuclease RecJ (EC [Lentimonas sp. CC10]CAA7071048.1 Single-stranded-DNA-specific exonuclease RecJ (EC [Lentimonas sp. CC11]
MLWTTTETNETLAAQLSDELRVSAVMGQLLAQRDLPTVEAAEEFLRPRLAQLDNPFALKNLRAAVTRIEQAIEGKESVVVFGDYDVDGVTSTVQLVSMLRTLGLEPRFCVPLRLDEGYGLSHDAIDRIFDGDVPELFIALDCGTNAHEPIAYLRELGCDVIVVDHHQTKTEAPKGCIFVNPHVNDPEDAPWRDLCTAGLVFKLLHGLLKSRREAEDPRVEGIQLKDYLDLVAMGTIADLVPLHRENRILSWFGLRHLRANGRIGVRALAEVSGIDASQEMASSDISFKLAPRINASGRLADATLPINLLLSDDLEQCKGIAQELDAMNRERQGIERGIAAEAERRAADEFADEPGIVLFGEDWHPGVVGIVASRVSRRFHKPCVILGADGDETHGSGRSVATVNLVEVFQRCTDLLGHWGGHPMAAGVSLPTANVKAFTARYLESLKALYPAGLPEPSLRLSTWLEVEDLEEGLLDELDRLHPFGQGNAEPSFGVRGVVLEEAPHAFGEGNFRFRMPAVNGSRTGVAGIAWRMHGVPEVGQPIDIAVRFSWNYWRNSRYPQVTLIDWKPSGEN